MSNVNANHRKTNQRELAGTNKNQTVKKSNKVVLPQETEKDTNYFLIPVFIMLCVIPFIMRLAVYDPHMTEFAWYGSGEEYSTHIDFFLYYKQRMFIIVSAIMALAAVIKSITQRKMIRWVPIFIPIAVYAFLALVSAILSKYNYFSFRGSFDLLESVFVLLGYGICVYYVYLFIDKEKDFKLILYFIIGLALVFGLIGLSQYIGHDFFASKIGYNLIVPYKYEGSELRFYLEGNRVYLTLFNPNYVGVYVALVLPIIVTMLFLYKKPIYRVLGVIAVIGLLICVVGSKSLSGIIGLGVAAVFILIFTRKYLIKRYYITIPVFVVLILGVVFLDYRADHYFLNKIKSTLEIEKSVPVLSDLQTADDGISITYNGYVLKAQYDIDHFGQSYLKTYDEDNQTIVTYIDQATGTYVLIDDRFPNIMMAPISGSSGFFYISIDGKQWNFFKNSTDGEYYYINRFNRLDKIITAPSVVFTGYERLASGRGYIWSRSIPLLKKYFLIGSGPDTFPMAFPQNDYFNLSQYGYSGAIINKPHNMYLQTGIQTGVVSLIAFVIFYLMYFVSSIKLYIKGLFNSFYAKFGVAVFVGTASYMVMGMANDSNLNTSPIFWTLMGVGIALNCKVKPLIAEELAALKAEKEAKAKEAAESTTKAAAEDNSEN